MDTLVKNFKIPENYKPPKKDFNGGIFYYEDTTNLEWDGMGLEFNEPEEQEIVEPIIEERVRNGKNTKRLF